MSIICEIYSNNTNTFLGYYLESGHNNQPQLIEDINKATIFPSIPKLNISTNTYYIKYKGFGKHSKINFSPLEYLELLKRDKV